MSGNLKLSIGPSSPRAYINRELSWLGFARRVLALAESSRTPLLERVKFAGITGMLHDEFFMKRISGLKNQIRKGSTKRSIDGRTPEEELAACREELVRQTRALAHLTDGLLGTELPQAGVPIVDLSRVEPDRRLELRDYFRRSVLPILTPLAVDAEHPFPFISNLGLNLALLLADADTAEGRFRAHQAAGQPAALDPTERRRWFRPHGTGPGGQPRPAVPGHSTERRFTRSG